ncbi:MAG: putative rane protein [Chloroflexi bacterium]|nr:putative rane protein [Chloroflexota bacterium]
MAEQKFYYGGQAVIEGVMMRGKQVMVTATRRPGGEVGVHSQPLSTLYTGQWRKTPLVRGVIALIESLVLGIQTLMYSANVALEEEQTKLSGWATWGIILVALAFAVGVFFMLPLFITNLLREHLQNTIVFNLIEGLIRVIIFVGYLTVVSMMKDIRRVFAYHGAEHKTINAYEAGQPLEVEYARQHTTANPRCGTSFLFAVLVIAIIVFSLVGKPSIAWMAVSRILLLPVIAALGYEFIYFTSRHSDNLIMKALLTPGLWLQSLTTRQPDDKQLEVAIAALKKVLEIEQPEKYAPPVEVAPSPVPATD